MSKNTTPTADETPAQSSRDEPEAPEAGALERMSEDKARDLAAGAVEPIELEAFDLGGDAAGAVARIMEQAVDAAEATGTLAAFNEREHAALSDLEGVPFIIAGYKWIESQTLTGPKMADESGVLQPGRPLEFVAIHVIRADEGRMGEQYAITTGQFGIMKQIAGAAARGHRLIRCRRGLRKKHVGAHESKQTGEMVPEYDAFWLA